MDQELLLSAGTMLLGVAALMGFVQARKASGSPEHSRWRVVHNGGTAGGVQLLALSAVWGRLAEESVMTSSIAHAIALSTWLFFVGPLLKAMSRTKSGNAITWAGAVAAVPGYVGLVGLALL